MKKTGFAVVGVRNFADTYIQNLKKLEPEKMTELTAVVVKDQIENAERVRELRGDGIKVFDSYQQLLSEGRDYVDVIALPVAIHTHTEMAIEGMKHGYHVLLEKPPAPTVEEVDQMIKVERATGKFCSIGFQFIHARSIRKLKEFLLNKKIGDLLELACKGYWPRYRSYYQRNSWAGKSIWNGRIVLDGPMHNAFAHFLNNLLFLASEKREQTAELKKVRAELYRAHTYIDADDTSCLKLETKAGVKGYFYVTHASRDIQDPWLEIIGTKGKAYWQFDEKTRIVLDNGQEIKFDHEGIDPWLEVLRTAALVNLGQLAKPYSTPENSRNFVVAINGAYDSAKRIRSIPVQYVSEYFTSENEFKTELQDIEKMMDQAFVERKLLSELGIEWAERTATIDVQNYRQFNPFQ